MKAPDTRPISDRQLSYITDLVRARLSQLGVETVDEGLSAVASLYGFTHLTEMLMPHAKAAISTLLAHTPDPQPEPVMPAGVDEAERYFSPNRYPTRRGEGCLACGEPVEAGAGYAITGVADQQTGWGILHQIDCADTTAEQRQAKKAQQVTEAQAKRDAERNKRTELRDLLAQLSHRVTRKSFRVAIFSMTTDNDLDFLGVYYQPGGKSNRIERHIGSAGYRPRTVRLSLDEQLDFAKRIMAFDDDRLVRAQEAYGRNLHYCGRCGAALTDHDSRLRGLGPDCANIRLRHTV